MTAPHPDLLPRLSCRRPGPVETGRNLQPRLAAAQSESGQLPCLRERGLRLCRAQAAGRLGQPGILLQRLFDQLVQLGIVETLPPPIG